MAKETLVIPDMPFFDAIREAVESLHNSAHGPLFLATVLELQDRPENEWTFVVGSIPLAKNRIEGMKQIAEVLSTTLTPEFAKKISRLGIVGENDDLLIRLASSISVKPIGRVAIENCILNGIHIRKGAVFVAQRNVRELLVSARKPRKAR